MSLSSQISIELSRDECRSESSVTIGSTRSLSLLCRRRDLLPSLLNRVLCVVNAEIVVPYPDRATEGMLQFTVDVSLSTEQAGHTSSQLCRMLERSIRDSEALDTESLCIIAGEKVWSIICDVKILNYDGNVIDACNLAAVCLSALLSLSEPLSLCLSLLTCAQMSALRAFRKPEVSVFRQDLLDSSSSAAVGATFTVVKLHNTDEREPLPLALHHTPLSITYGVLGVKQHLMAGAKLQVPSGDLLDFSHSGQSSILLLSDPTSEEEAILEGYITFSVNAHR
jgi:exosome complex component RRP45